MYIATSMRCSGIEFSTRTGTYYMEYIALSIRILYRMGMSMYQNNQYEYEYHDHLSSHYDYSL